MTSPAPSSRQRWLVPVVVVVLSVTVGAGLLARELYRRPDQPADESTAATSTPSPASSGAQSPAGFVQMSDDAKYHPQADAVRELIKTYFEAINTKQWSLWLRAVSSKRAAQQSAGEWKAGVKSTEDSEAVVYRIERGANGSLRVLVGFTSRQNKADAPDFFPETCIKWRLVLPVVEDKTGLKIDTVDPGPAPEHEKC